MNATTAPDHVRQLAHDYAYRQTCDDDLAEAYAAFYALEYPDGTESHATVFWQWQTAPS